MFARLSLFSLVLLSGLVACGEPDGDGGLKACAEERDLEDIAEGLEVQLHADEEEEEEHAEFREEVDAFRRMDEAEAARSEHDACQDVTDDGGLAEPHQGEAAAQRDDDEQGDGVQRENVMHAWVAREKESAGSMITQGWRRRKRRA